MHETRIIPLNGQPHVDSSVRQWLGDSRGHWEGSTLVVDTTNFLPRENAEWQDAWRASRSTTHVVERFTRVDANLLDYEVTVDDPATFTRKWTASIRRL